MRVRALLFGPLAEIYGIREEWLELGASPRAADVYRHYRELDSRIGQLESALHVAVNQEVVAPDHPLAPEDEVALLPPVCGGSEADADSIDLIELVETPLESYPWRKHLAESSANFGGLVCFEGLVRREEQSDPVLALEFDAYRPMAISALRSLAREARERWPIECLVMLHRLGTVPAGEICVIVAISTGHRAEAFAGCKFLIDTLKATVPIWKKEITASNSRWVEGTLLPSAEHQGGKAGKPANEFLSSRAKGRRPEVEGPVGTEK